MDEPCLLPGELQVGKVIQNVLNNLRFQSGKSRSWKQEFCSAYSLGFVAEAFWLVVLCFFQNTHPDAPLLESVFFDRLARSYFLLFHAIAKKDTFFQQFADASSQFILYSLFLAYPKSRPYFTMFFRRQLFTLIHYWTTGIHPEFICLDHWKLNLGGGNVLSTTYDSVPTSFPPLRGQGSSLPSPRQASARQGAAVPVSSSSREEGGCTSRQMREALGSDPFHCSPLQQLSLGVSRHDGMAGQDRIPVDRATASRLIRSHKDLIFRPTKVTRMLRFSPLLAHFYASQRYSQCNLVPIRQMRMVQAEDRTLLLDLKHMLMQQDKDEAAKVKR